MILSIIIKHEHTQFEERTLILQNNKKMSFKNFWTYTRIRYSINGQERNKKKRERSEN